jgi:hypothetical protein
MRAKYALLLVSIVVVAIWLLMRDRSETTARHETNTPQVAPDRVTATRAMQVADQPTAAGRAQPDPDRVHAPPAIAAPSATSPPATVPGAAVSPGSAAGRPGLPPPSSVPPVPAPSSDDMPNGRFNDKTGWSDRSVAKQLNREFMPLASECIEHAKGRKPFLSGLLSFTMVITPTGEGKAVVSKLKIRPDNKIEDPELWECIRESSFALEGLTAPHDFDITMPVTRDDDGG